MFTRTQIGPPALNSRLRVIRPTLVGCIFIFCKFFTTPTFIQKKPDFMVCTCLLIGLNQSCGNCFCPLILCDFLLDRFFIWPFGFFVFRNRITGESQSAVSSLKAFPLNRCCIEAFWWSKMYFTVLMFDFSCFKKISVINWSLSVVKFWSRSLNNYSFFMFKCSNRKLVGNLY